jgi:hypothetical protein
MAMTTAATTHTRMVSQGRRTTTRAIQVNKRLSPQILRVAGSSAAASLPRRG